MCNLELIKSIELQEKRTSRTLSGYFLNPFSARSSPPTYLNTFVNLLAAICDERQSTFEQFPASWI